jgi:hypothetical protein
MVGRGKKKKDLKLYSGEKINHKQKILDGNPTEIQFT